MLSSRSLSIDAAAELSAAVGFAGVGAFAIDSCIGLGESFNDACEEVPAGLDEGRAST